MKRHPSLPALLATAGLLSSAALAQETPAPAPPGPANLCKELLAFVKPPEASEAAAPAAPQQTTAVSTPTGQNVAQPSSAAGETQQKSGLSGPVPSSEGPSSAPKFNDVHGKANADAKVAPPPGTPKPAPKPDEAMIQKVEAAASANDQTACRAAAQTMRKAGMALPAPLLALAALDPKLLTQR